MAECKDAPNIASGFLSRNLKFSSDNPLTKKEAFYTGVGGLIGFLALGGGGGVAAGALIGNLATRVRGTCQVLP